MLLLLRLSEIETLKALLENLCLKIQFLTVQNYNIEN